MSSIALFQEEDKPGERPGQYVQSPNKWKIAHIYWITASTSSIPAWYLRVCRLSIQSEHTELKLYRCWKM